MLLSLNISAYPQADILAWGSKKIINVKKEAIWIELRTS
jgi:hypothetical protein